MMHAAALAILFGETSDDTQVAEAHIGDLLKGMADEQRRNQRILGHYPIAGLDAPALSEIAIPDLPVRVQGSGRVSSSRFAPDTPLSRIHCTFCS